MCILWLNALTTHFWVTILLKKRINEYYYAAIKHDYTRFNTFYYPIKSLLLRMKWVFRHQDFLIFGLKLNK